MNTQSATRTYPENLPELDNDGWHAAYDRYYTPNYGARRIALVRGAGTRVWDANGREYLDFLTGISVNNLGHCHPRITRAIQEQAATLVHCTNLYYIPVQIELARLLIENSFADRLFFSNSGAEANEAAIKLARRWTTENRGAGKPEIICMQQSFHGRTLATLTATGNEKIKLNFEPLPEGFLHAPFNDLGAAEALVNERTCAILVEQIQGEGGINVETEEYLKGLRALCDARGILLIFDEVQSGLGRAGALFAHQLFGVEPDIMTLAKSLGGGLAMGAMLCRERLAGAFAPGAHGSTMGGNPLTAAAAHAYVSELIEGEWPRKAGEAGCKLWGLLAAEFEGNANVKEIRGRGLMLGVELTSGGPEIVTACEREGVLINCTAGQTLRIMPPLNVTEEELARAARVIGGAVREVSAGQAV